MIPISERCKTCGGERRSFRNINGAEIQRCPCTPEALNDVREWLQEPYTATPCRYCNKPIAYGPPWGWHHTQNKYLPGCYMGSWRIRCQNAKGNQFETRATPRREDNVVELTPSDRIFLRQCGIAASELRNNEQLELFAPQRTRRRGRSGIARRGTLW